MLAVSIGQAADKGRKAAQQDFHGALVPRPPERRTKGVALAVADGISSSDVAAEASQRAVGSFLADYYCTPDAWSVKTSVERVVAAANSWLHAQTQRGPHRYERERGWVCTFSALVLKSRTAHVFHVGDTRVARLAGRVLEPLTDDHRVALGDGRSLLARALGMETHVEIDYRALPLAEGDIFVLATDGVHEHIDGRSVAAALERHAGDLDAAAHALVCEALARGSDDNLTLQLVRVDTLPPPAVEEFAAELAALALPPPLSPRMVFDGYTVLRELHASHRSHIHLARDDASGALVAIKTPSVDGSADPAYLERFLLEDWVARRIDDPHVLKAHPPARPRHWLYVVYEYIDGRTLAQWLRDQPQPRLDDVRAIVEQVARGLNAFHRLEMLHQDLRPENVMIDGAGVVRIIDFGAVRVAGLAEMTAAERGEAVLGTEQYAAPEYFLGEGGTPRSDLYSLGVIAYQMLSGRLPYGAQVARLRTRSALGRLAYESVLDTRRETPAWLDGVLRKAVHPNPLKRHEALSEFVHDLRHPPPAYLARARPALAERDPVALWRGVALVLALVVLVLLHALATRPHSPL